MSFQNVIGNLLLLVILSSVTVTSFTLWDLISAGRVRFISQRWWQRPTNSQNVVTELPAILPNVTESPTTSTTTISQNDLQGLPSQSDKFKSSILAYLSVKLTFCTQNYFDTF